MVGKAIVFPLMSGAVVKYFHRWVGNYACFGVYKIGALLQKLFYFLRDCQFLYVFLVRSPLCRSSAIFQAAFLSLIGRLAR